MYSSSQQHTVLHVIIVSYFILVVNQEEHIEGYHSLHLSGRTMGLPSGQQVEGGLPQLALVWAHHGTALGTAKLPLEVLRV